MSCEHRRGRMPCASTTGADAVRPDCNEHGEQPDTGMPWACARYGSPGHDQETCLDCAAALGRYMDNCAGTIHGTVMMGGEYGR